MSQDQVGVKPEEWASVVSNAKKGVHGIITLSKKEISKTTLSRFKKFNTIQDSWNSALTSYKSYGEARTDMMTKMGEKIVEDDAVYASQIDKNKNYVRFN